MTNLVSTANNLLTFSPEQVDLIKRTVAKGATDDELKLFLYQCQRTGLDPFSRQIYFVKYGDKVTIITAIDGYRTIAERTGKYAGSDDPNFYEVETEIAAQPANRNFPRKATVTVYKMVEGQRCPFTATARWEEYYPKQNRFKWDQMPHMMLAKCAEALALRKAFPNDLSGLYVQEEMDQAEKLVKVIPPKKENENTSPRDEIGSYEEYKIFGEPYKNSDYFGRSVREVPIDKLEVLVQWTLDKSKTMGKLTPDMAQFLEHSRRFLSEEKKSSEERARRNSGIPEITQENCF